MTNATFYPFSDHHLISPHVNIAKSVEILILSGNDITQIDNEALKELKEIINLSLSRNSISEIEIFAFVNLKKLSVLDLSENRLETSSFDSRFLESNEIKFLDFSRNKFMNAENSPLIRSKTLEVLLLRNSHLSHVHDRFFEKIPNLLNLDVSENLLLTIPNQAVKSLPQLQFINLEYNRFSCDLISEMLQRLKKKKVVIKIDVCGKNSRKPMFEKMIMLPSTPPPQDIDIDEVWSGVEIESMIPKVNQSFEDFSLISFSRFYEKLKTDENFAMCEKNRIEISNVCECSNQFVGLYERSNVTAHLIINHAHKRIIAAFIIGIIIGITFGCCVYYSIQSAITIWKNMRKTQQARQNVRDELEREVIGFRLAEHQNDSQAENLIQSQSNQRVSREQWRSVVTNRPESTRNSRTQEMSATAQLLHKLFRDRNSRGPIEIRTQATPSLTIYPISNLQNISSSSNRMSLEEAQSSNPLPIAPEIIEVDETIPEEIVQENEGSRSSTPPPPYISIFD